MEVARRAKTEPLLKQNLPRRRIEQIRPAHYVGNTLLGIVDDDGQLISEHAICAQDDEITHFALDDLLDVSLHAVGEADGSLVRKDAHRARIGPGTDAVAASSWIDAVRGWLSKAHRRVLDLFASAAAPVRMAGTVKRVKRGAVKIEARALIDDRPVPFECKRLELAQDRRRYFRLRPRRIEILDSHE